MADCPHENELRGDAKGLIPGIQALEDRARRLGLTTSARLLKAAKSEAGRELTEALTRQYVAEISERRDVNEDCD